jgi:RecA/RadA recombinase
MTVKPLDLAKFRKDITKNIPGLSMGFRDPKVWISTGNYALNYAISGRFKDGGIPLGKVTMLGGQSGCLPEYAKVTIRIQGQSEGVEIRVGALKELWQQCQKIEIHTPDGYQPVINWFDKGELPMVKVSLDNGETTLCATNHLVQVMHDGTLVWKLAGELDIGDQVLTDNPHTPYGLVTAVVDQPDEECYDFEIGHENHRYWGDGVSSHNSGKSFLASGNITANAQKKDVFVVLVDTENALDETWLKALDVDTSEDKLLKANLAMVDDVAKLISDFMKDYKTQYGAIDEDQRPRVLFVIDSLGMMLTPTDVNQFEAGDLKGDMGRKPKALAALVRNCVNMFGEYDVGMVCTNHSYASQDMFNPDDVISGGQGQIYASSIVLAMRKLKLKEDEMGNKTTEVKGIRAQCKVMKTRYNQPFTSVEVKIPYDRGMDPYSGLFDLFVQKGLLTKEGNRWTYACVDGTQIKQFEKAWDRNEDNCLDRVMDEFDIKLNNHQVEKNLSHDPIN